MATIASTSASAQTASRFDGFYVGAHAGYGKIEDTDDIDFDGGLVGLHAGYNYVHGSLLLGAEADIDWSGIEFSARNSGGSWTKGQMNYYASVRGRIGWTNGNTLIYATAGYSWNEYEAKFEIPGLMYGKISASIDGPVVGGGVEYMLSQQLSARVEGLHYWQEQGIADDDSIEADTNVIRAGLSYHLR